LVPFLSGFLGCIFDLFLDAALLVRDVFQRTFQKLMGVLDPILGLLLDGLFITRRFVSLVGLVVFQVCVGFMCLVGLVGYLVG
jgi:hypothetical protein